MLLMLLNLVAASTAFRAGTVGRPVLAADPHDVWCFWVGWLSFWVELVLS